MSIKNLVVNVRNEQGFRVCYDAAIQNTPPNKPEFPMELNDIINKSCIIGLSYFDGNNQLLKQSMLAGHVATADEENGISVSLIVNDTADNPPLFILPSSLTPWFNAPKGTYKDEAGSILIENPDFLVTWDIHRTQENKEEGDHEWWNWVPRTTPPSVG